MTDKTEAPDTTYIWPARKRDWREGQWTHYDTSGPHTGTSGKVEYTRTDLHQVERDRAWNEALEAVMAMIDKNEAPCEPVYPNAWTADALAHYQSGQLDASNSWKTTIRALKRETDQ